MNYNTELYHHGILGQKWGVRRYQNPDGSLTAEGKKRYGTVETLNAHQEKKKKNVKRVAISVGTVAVIAAGAYFCKKYIDKNADKTLSNLTNFQHLGRNKAQEFTEPVYLSYIKSDKKKYISSKPGHGFDTNWQYNQTINTKQNVKIAGTKTSVDIFKEWIKNNPEYESRFGKVSSYDKQSIKKAYKLFIKEAPPSMSIYDKKLASDFFKKMTENGYDAVRDTFDQDVMKVRSPIILFNGIQDLMIKSVSSV